MQLAVDVSIATAVSIIAIVVVIAGVFLAYEEYEERKQKMQILCGAATLFGNWNDDDLFEKCMRNMVFTFRGIKP